MFFKRVRDFISNSFWSSVFSFELLKGAIEEIYSHFKNKDFNGNWILSIYGDSKNVFSIVRLKQHVGGFISIKEIKHKHIPEEDILNSVLIDISQSNAKRNHMCLTITIATGMGNSGIASLAMTPVLGLDGNRLWRGEYINAQFENGMGSGKSRITLTKVEKDANIYELIKNSNIRKLTERAPLVAGIEISIIITVYNDCENVGRCLNSIFEHCDQKRKIQIIVVDGGSIDYTEKAVQQHPNRNDILYIKTLYRGKSFARNIGLSYACGKYVMFLDGSSILRENFFRNADNLIVNYPGIDIYLGGRMEKQGDLVNKSSCIQATTAKKYKIKEFLLARDDLSNLQLGSVTGKLYNNHLIRSKDLLIENEIYGDTLFNLELLTCAKNIYADSNVWFYLNKRNVELYENTIMISDFLAGQMSVYLRYLDILEHFPNITDKERKKCQNSYWMTMRKRINRKIEETKRPLR